MGDGFYQPLTKALKKAGWEYLCQAKGSHEKWHHPETGEQVLVPPSTKSRHTANGIAKDAGLGKLF